MSDLISFNSFSLGAEQHRNVINKEINQKVRFPNGGVDPKYSVWVKDGTALRNEDGTQKLTNDRIKTLIAQVGKEVDALEPGAAAGAAAESSVKKSRKTKEDDFSSKEFKNYIKGDWFDTVKPQKTDAAFNELKAKAYRLYLASASSLLPFKVLGDDSVRADKCLRENVGRLYTPTEGVLVDRLGPDLLTSLLEKDAAPLSDGKEPLQYFGSVLFDTDWNIMKNDAVVLGCIHSNQPAYLTFSVNTLSQMDDEKFFSGKFIKVQFREIIQLAAAGYKMVIPDGISKQDAPLDLDNIILVRDQSTAHESRFNMSDMLNAIDGIDSAAKVREALGKIECISYRDYMAGVPFGASDSKNMTLSDVCKIITSRPDSVCSADIEDGSVRRSFLSSSPSSSTDVDSLLDRSSVNLVQEDDASPSFTVIEAP